MNKKVIEQGLKDYEAECEQTRLNVLRAKAIGVVLFLSFLPIPVVLATI
jgi:hypothetical protein